MSSDASAAAASPMTNGIASEASHREADASTERPPPHSSGQTLIDVCADLYLRVSSFLNANAQDDITRRTQEQTRISMGVIQKALEDYEFETLSLSYNGGKDCLVLLILYLAAIHVHFADSKTQKPFPKSIPSIYAKPPDPFPQVSAFVDSSTKEYHLDLTHISTNPGPHAHPKQAKTHSSPSTHTDNQAQAQEETENLQPSLATAGGDLSAHEPSTLTSADIIANRQTSHAATLPPNDAQAGHRIVTFRDAFALYLQANPQVLAIFVGTRRTDPHGRHLTHFDMTDGKWPRFMRIHPVIDWQLGEIWTFLRSPHLADKKKGQDVLEYCQMYDEGYTSLGGVNDTLRNPRLKVVDPETGRETWQPAYCLVEDGEERLGRE